MIFADKLVQLRKKSGWSQEELAEQMNVTRQSVSKWEGAQSIPDLEKIVRLSELFGVSTDYLLRDEMEETDQIQPTEDVVSVRRVSMEEANAFLSVKEATAKPIAYAVFLCMLSPICLLLLGAVSECSGYGLSENIAATIGLIVLLVLVAAAVSVFISCGSKTSPYEYMEKEFFETEYGVIGMVREHREKYRNFYMRGNVIGTCLCIISAIPVIMSSMTGDEDEILSVVLICVTLVVAGIGVVFLIRVGIIWESFEKLLQEGDYVKEKKEKRPILSAIATSYWLTATAIFLAYSFKTSNWKYSWIIWVVAGVLYPAIITISNILVHKSDK